MLSWYRKWSDKRADKKQQQLQQKQQFQRNINNVQQQRNDDNNIQTSTSFIPVTPQRAGLYSPTTYDINANTPNSYIITTNNVSPTTNTVVQQQQPTTIQRRRSSTPTSAQRTAFSNINVSPLSSQNTATTSPSQTYNNNDNSINHDLAINEYIPPTHATVNNQQDIDSNNNSNTVQFSMSAPNLHNIHNDNNSNTTTTTSTDIDTTIVDSNTQQPAATHNISINNITDTTEDFRLSDEMIAWRLQQEEYDRHAQRQRHNNNNNQQSRRGLLGYIQYDNNNNNRSNSSRSNNSNNRSHRSNTDTTSNSISPNSRRHRSNRHHNSNNNNNNSILHGTEDEQRQQLQQILAISGLGNGSPSQRNNNRTHRSNTSHNNDSRDLSRSLLNIFSSMMRDHTAYNYNAYNNRQQNQHQQYHQHQQQQQQYRRPVSTKKPASVLLIESLPTYRYKATDQTTTTIVKQDHTCSICICEFEQDDVLRMLPCLHRYHKDCVDKWLSINRLCPTCNTDVKKAIQQRHSRDT